jgi:hypothetical protein
VSELLSLPAGDPEAGFVRAPKEDYDALGALPDEETQWYDDHSALIQEDTDRVQTAEDAVARQRIADAETLATSMRVSSIWPQWAKLGDPSFLLHVIGSGFTPTTKIVFAGNPEPISFVSPTEITTWINMPLWQGPDFITVGATETSVGEEGDAIGECVFQFTI